MKPQTKIVASKDCTRCEGNQEDILDSGKEIDLCLKCLSEVTPAELTGKAFQYVIK